MKALILLLLMPALMLIGCGQMETNQGSADAVLTNLNANGDITDAELNSVSEDLLAEEVTLTETNGPSSIMMKVGGAELLIDFIEDLQGLPEETAMVINGVEVPLNILQSPQDFQGLVASLVTSQLQGIDILGIPAGTLVQAGINLIQGDAGQADFSNLFGTLIKGAMSMFLSGTPYGAIFNVIAAPIIDNVLGLDNQNGAPANQPNTNQQNQNQNQNNSGGGVLGTIVDTIGGVLTGGNPLLGGLFSLITNLFK